MQCVSCDTELTTDVTQPNVVAAYAIMRKEDAPKGRTADVLGVGAFHAFATCATCYRDASKRKRMLKAHFALPGQLPPMLKHAGSSSKIGG